ncbi:hypothetical protein SLA2020_150830 [Shorea laevis]
MKTPLEKVSNVIEESETMAWAAILKASLYLKFKVQTPWLRTEVVWYNSFGPNSIALVMANLPRAWLANFPRAWLW